MPIVGIVSISFILIMISLYGINDYFSQKAKKTEENTKQSMIDTAMKNIRTIKNLSQDIDMVIKDSFKREVRLEVDSGINIINRICKTYSHLSKKEKIEKIKNVLRDFRFFDDKSGYFFIYDKKGNVILLPIKPSLEGKNLLNFRDIKGKYIIREFITKLKKNPNGVFEEWYYYLPGTNIMKKKLGYSKYYKDLDILIGTAIYYVDIKKEIRKRFFHTVSKIENINYSKLVILDDYGEVVYTKNDMSQHSLERAQRVVKIAKSDKDKIHTFISKDSKTMQIFSYYKPLNMTIVSKICLDKLQEVAKNSKKDVDKIMHLVISQFLMTAIAFIMISLLISLYISKNIEKIFFGYEESLIKAKNIALENSKIKSEFLANMSHEIRTPLNAMLGFIQILKDKDFSKEDKEHLNIVEKSGQNLLAIINDILDFSKIEAGKFKIELIEFNPKEDIRVVHGLFAAYASEKNISLKTKTQNLDYNIISDATRVKQVIANLLSNAIKFTSSNKKIELNAKYDKQKQMLHVEVVDEGIGIAKEKINTILQAFTQADSSTTRKYGGTGLGLTISYKLIQLLGGELKVESEVGKGSKFYFEIPAKKSSKIVESSSPKQESIKNLKFNYHILLVEDNHANQMFMQVLLKKLGVSYDIANDGTEAIKEFEENRYDMIFMDENMPIMNGIEATKKIREIEKEKGLNRTIIVALTANSLEGDEERFLEAGMDMYLAKPLDIKKLITVFKDLSTRGV